MNILVDELLKKCPVQHSLKFIGGKWRIGIIWSMKTTYRRFGELKRDVLGITEKMLIQELRHLESLGVVHREVYYVDISVILTPKTAMLTPL